MTKRKEILQSSILWSENLLELKEHLAATGGVYPKSNPGTQQMYDWVNRNRNLLRDGKLSEHRKSALDEMDPSWHLKAQTPQTPWKERLRDYASFVSTHGRVPSEYSENREERSLQKWMINQKSFAHKKRDAAERMTLINEAVPGSFDMKRKRIDWGEGLRLFIAFLSDHQRFPSAKSTDPDEKFIGKWIRAQRESRTVKRDSKHADRAAKLDTVFPAWRGAYSLTEQEWKDELERLAAYLRDSDR